MMFPWFLFRRPPRRPMVIEDPPGNARAHYAEYRRTIWDRLGFRQAARAPRPESEEELPGFAPSWFVVGTRIRLDWKDRIRVLVSGNAHVDIAIKTDKMINRSLSSSDFAVLPPGAHHQVLIPDVAAHRFGLAPPEAGQVLRAAPGKDPPWEWAWPPGSVRVKSEDG